MVGTGSPSLVREGGGMTAQSPLRAMCPNPNLFETKGVGHTFPCREGLAGFAQELLPLRSGLTSPCGDQLTTPQGGLTLIVPALILNSPHSRRSLLRPSSPSAPGGLPPPGSDSSLLPPGPRSLGSREAPRSSLFDLIGQMLESTIRGGEAHMAVLTHMAALARGSMGRQQWFSDTQA